MLRKNRNSLRLFPAHSRAPLLYCTNIDCTLQNIGRDLPLLREVSERSGINIVATSGFYYTREQMLMCSDEEEIAEAVIYDVQNVSHAGLIKYAVETKEPEDYDLRMLRVMASAQKALRLPLCVHTNAYVKNDEAVLSYLLEQGVDPKAITLAHLSDTDDLDFIESLLHHGIYAGFDRILSDDDAYLEKKAENLSALIGRGYAGQLLLSHDDPLFNGFSARPRIKEYPVFGRIFRLLLPKLRAQGVSEDDIRRITTENPARMLCCGS